MSKETKKEATVVSNKSCDKCSEKIVELSDRMNYVVKTIQDHADFINELSRSVKQVKGRMGL